MTLSVLEPDGATDGLIIENGESHSFFPPVITLGDNHDITVKVNGKKIEDVSIRTIKNEVNFYHAEIKKTETEHLNEYEAASDIFTDKNHSVTSNSNNLSTESFRENPKIQSENYDQNINYSLQLDLLNKLNITQGQNEIEYSLTTKLLGTRTVKGFIYYWPSSTKIAVWDIDGTITNSDLGGHIYYAISYYLPFFDRFLKYFKSFHEGVSDLLDTYSKNDIKIIYLTARPVSMSEHTRHLLRKNNQNETSLPAGPLILSHESIFVAFYNEVIAKNTYLIKIENLEKLVSLFERSPFLVAYGNKETDKIAYKKVGVSNIFIKTNERIKAEHENYIHSYKEHHEEIKKLIKQTNQSEAIIETKISTETETYESPNRIASSPYGYSFENITSNSGDSDSKTYECFNESLVITKHAETTIEDCKPIDLLETTWKN